MQDNNGTNNILAASQFCPLNYCNKEQKNVTLTEPDSQGNYNHSSILCGGCQPGLSLALCSKQCLQCSNGDLALLIPFTLAGSVLMSFIKFLDLTISQGIYDEFYANILQANQYILIFFHGGSLILSFSLVKPRLGCRDMLFLGTKCIS